MCVRWSVSPPTYIHDLLGGILGDPIEHDAGEHGAQQEGEAAGDPLDTGEGAAGGPAHHREPEVPVAEARERLAVDQITGAGKYHLNTGGE